MSQHFDWDLALQMFFLYILPSYHINLRDQPWRLETAHTLVHIWKTFCKSCNSCKQVCSCKLSAKVSLMLENPFPVPSLSKLDHINIFFIQISRKFTLKQLDLFREWIVFWSDSCCFGSLGKFQHNTKIPIKTACVSRLSFRFLWLC